MRNSARKHNDNRMVKSRLKSLERNYADLVEAGKKDEAATAFRGLSSAFDKAAKRGIIHKTKANRKKSRLSIPLLKLK